MLQTQIIELTYLCHMMRLRSIDIYDKTKNRLTSLNSFKRNKIVELIFALMISEERAFKLLCARYPPLKAESLLLTTFEGESIFERSRISRRDKQ